MPTPLNTSPAQHKTPILSNYDVALKAEAKRVNRIWKRWPLTYRPVQRGNRPVPDGYFIYVHPNVEGICFRTRGEAARRALSQAEVA